MNPVDSLIKERLKTNKQVIITSAYPLTQEEVILIKKDLPDLNNTQINFEIDKRILAGVIIKIGSLVIDQSLKTKINKYLKYLYENN